MAVFGILDVLGWHRDAAFRSFGLLCSSALLNFTVFKAAFCLV
jgi:hypothetical protein